jgi:SAM-dependent methyltransferase
VRRLRLSGAAAELRVALDRLHVHATVLCAVEGDGECDVMFEGDAPDLGPVKIEELDPDEEPVSGLEGDHAMRVGERIMIRPPWVPSPPDFEGIELVVPRAMAFGSGEHGSTQAALCMMERLIDDEIESLADVGTGSGILALYAEARGCERIFACDIDPDAVAVARELLPDANVFCGGPDAIPASVDAVVANMRTAEIRSCIEDLLAGWNRRGPMILSGLRSGDEREFDDDVGRESDERIEIAGFVSLGWRGESSSILR